MLLYEKIEYAKDLANKKKFKEALKEFQFLAGHVQSKDIENIYFEMLKIYAILNDNNRALNLFLKIKSNDKYKLWAANLLFDNYRKMDMKREIFFLYKQLIKEEYKIPEDLLEYLIHNDIKQRRYKNALKIINSLEKEQLKQLHNTICDLYQNIIKYMQKLNIEGKSKVVEKLYFDIFKYIPDSEIKIKNILLNEYEISKKTIVLKSLPRVLNLVLTSKCNLRCIMCENYKQNIELTDKQYDDILEIMPYLQKIILRGGEVFFDKRLSNLLDITYKNNVIVEIVTNGLLLDDDVIINKIFNNKAEITFSIDSVNKEIYESIRMGGKFEKLLQNIKKFNRLKKIKHPNILTRLTMVVMRRNYKEIEDVICFAKKYDFNEIHLIPVYGSYVGKNENFFDYSLDCDIIEELNRKKKIFAGLADKYHIKLNNRLPDVKKCISDSQYSTDFRIRKQVKYNNIIHENSNNEKLFCLAPWQQIFFINNNIAIPTCMCSFLNNNKIYKNKKNFIIYKWNSDEMLEYRTRIVSNMYKELCIKNYLCGKNIL